MKYRGSLRRLMVAGAVILLPAGAWAALPLITDDTGTQGKGKFQFEIGGEYDRDRETVFGVTIRETDTIIGTTLTYGLTDRTDIFIGAPYTWNTVKEEGVPDTRAHGIGDTALGAKWRFWENVGLSLGLKPFITLPSANDSKGMGSGKIGLGIFFITTAEYEPWTFHVNLGYILNENTLNERKDVWHASLASDYAVSKNWKLCTDIGTETNRDRASEIEPRYALAGIIYSPAEHIELSLGVKHGLNDEEIDWSLLPGITYRF